jgi:hypothetical protein
MPPNRRHPRVDIATESGTGKDYSRLPHGAGTSLGRVVERLDLKMQPVPDLATIALPGGEQRPRLVRGLSLHAPFFAARDQHGGMEGPALSPDGSGYGTPFGTPRTSSRIGES